MKRIAVLSAALALGLGSRPVLAEFALTDSDRVMFFGPTACWEAFFGVQVETFLAVKYPQLKARFWHWQPPLRQTIVQGQERLGDHLKAFRPTVVVLNFGLDAGESRALDEARLAAFRTDLIGMIDRCQSAGARVILVTPNCPEAHRKQVLTGCKYDEVVGRYAQSVREIGSERNLSVVDWYALTREAAADSEAQKSAKKALTSDGLHPTPLAHTLAAEALLETLGAEPHEVTVHIDWPGPGARTTAGSISATRQTDSTVRVELKDFPMPWVIPGRGRAMPMKWGPSRLCRFTFHVHNAPPGGVLISTPGGRPTPWLEQMLEEGFDMSTVGPLVGAEPLRQLMKWFRRKTGELNKLDRWMREPVPEPEYTEAHVKYTEAMVAETEGTARIIARTPRTIDLTLEITLARPPAKQKGTGS